jgi:hypothetical protein
MEPILRVGVVADTHIPDRARSLHPGLIPALRAAGVERILHAGDISIRSVIEELEQVAPVDLARGNRDWAFRDARWVTQLHLAGVPVALMHGHINWYHYLTDKWYYVRDGYRLERYMPRLAQAAGDARVIVFGHTHRSEIVRLDGRLFFNPGSAGFGFKRNLNPSWGLLKFFAGGRVEGEVFELSGYGLQDRAWARTP